MVSSFLGTSFQRKKESETKMFVENFSDNIIAYQSGAKKPKNFGDVCCFSLLKEYDYLINSKPEDMDNAFVLNKISEASFGVKNAELIKKLKRKSTDGNIFFIVDHDLKEAILFRNGTEKQVIKAHFDEQKNGFDNPEIDTYFKKSMDEFRNLASCQKKRIAGKNISFISVRRDFDRYLPLSEFHLDRSAKKNNVTSDKLSLLAMSHEIGHANDKKLVERGGLNNPTPYSIQHKQELYADIYAAINLVASEKNTATVDLWSNYRNNFLIKKLSLLATDTDATEKTIAENSIHNTSDGLDAFTVFANKKLKHNPDFFANLDDRKIDHLCRWFSEKYALNSSRFMNLVKETKDKKIGPETRKVLLKQKRFFESNGYSVEENYDNWEKVINNTRDSMETKRNSRREISKDERQVRRSFIKSLVSDSKKNDYYTAFLNAYIKTKKNIVLGVSSSSDNETLNKMKFLDRVLKEEKENYKSIVALHDYFSKVEVDKKYKSMGKKASLTAYIKNKQEFLMGIEEVIKDINTDNIGKGTEKLFKKAMKNAKTAHYVAEKASKCEKLPFVINEMLNTDIRNDYPKELNEFFMSSDAGLKGMSTLVKEQKGLIAYTINNTKNR